MTFFNILLCGVISILSLFFFICFVLTAIALYDKFFAIRRKIRMRNIWLDKINAMDQDIFLRKLFCYLQIKCKEEK